MSNFRSAVIIILAHDEVLSLLETVQGIQAMCKPEEIMRIVIFLSPRATEDCRREANALACAAKPIPVLVVQEQGGAIARELQELLRGQLDTATHALLWSADQDAPLETIPKMLKKAKEQPNAVVTLSRFIPGGSQPAGKQGFINIRDYIFTRLVCIFFHCKQTDPYFSWSLFPIQAFVHFNLREPFMAFAIEYSLCFERARAQFIEIPIQQQLRQEGKSALSVGHKLRFFVPVLRLRFTPRRRIYKEDPDGET